jgi:hypothetical protein
LFLLMEGAEVSTQTLGARGPAKIVGRAADTLIDAHLLTALHDAGNMPEPEAVH